MKGRNTIGLNQRTLCAAVQMYLDSHRKHDAPKIEVTSVRVDGQCRPGFDCLHVIADVIADVTSEDV